MVEFPHQRPAWSGKRGTRQAIDVFSPRSRRALLDKLASVNRKQAGLPLFVTLTYPDRFPQVPARWKQDIERFIKRLQYEHGRFACVWRLELQVRKSGLNRDKVAPHFHLLMFMDKQPRQLYESVSRHWYEACGKLDPKHLKAGTKVERVYSWRGVMNYAAKYLAKLESLDLPADGVASWRYPGRYWGVWCRDLLPIHYRELRPDLRSALAIKRHIRKYSGIKPRDKFTSMYAYLGSDACERLAAFYGSDPPT